MQVRSPGLWPKVGNLPSLIEAVLPAGSADRVAIIANQDFERLERDIKDLLSEKLRVPNVSLEACRSKLRADARTRMCGAGGGRWTREELEEVIRDHDGYIASSPELEHYIQPLNWAEIKEAVHERNGVLITGQSGTGKTMATLKLYDELRKEIPGLARVPIKYGPGQISDDRTPPPVLYDIEDPWGRYDFDPRSRPWNDQLARCFANARPNRLVVATSRLDVAMASGALDTVKRWNVSLNAEHYGTRERRLLYMSRIDGLPRNIQGIANDNQSRVLAELSTPLEIQKFFDALATPSDGEKNSESRLITDAIKRAHHDSIERTVVDQIEERKDVRAAAVLWGLLKANDKLSLQLLRKIDSALADANDAFDKGAAPLAHFFVAARNLRQVEDTLSYYHPRVEAGIEQALKRDENVTVKSLRLLINTLSSLDGPDKQWGIAASARLLYSLDRTRDLRPQVPIATQASIDAWLTDLVPKGGEEFEHNLRLAGSIGSSTCNVAEVARFLLNRRDDSLRSLLTWCEPEHAEDWYSRMRADQLVKEVVEKFIRDVLPRGRVVMRKDFVIAVEKLAANLTASFLGAAASAVPWGHIMSAEAILTGSLRDLQGFESIVDLAVAELAPSQSERDRTAELVLSRKNREINDEDADYYAEDDSGWVARNFLAGYVDEVRARLGWKHLLAHRLRDELLETWLERLDQDITPSADELRGIYAITRHCTEEALLWRVLTRHWLPEFEQEMVDLVVTGHEDVGVRIGSLTCLVDRAPGRFAGVINRLLQDGNEVRLVEIASELGEVRYRRNVSEKSLKQRPWPWIAPDLPSPFGEVADATYAVLAKLTPNLSAGAQSVLSRISPVREEVRALRMRLDSHVPVGSVEDARWLLTHCDDVEVAESAMDFLIRHGFSEDVQAGLSHRFADVVGPALNAVGSVLMAPLPPSILALARNKGSRVCRTLVELLDARPHPDHRTALLELAKNEWSKGATCYGEEVDLQIAQSAVAALGKLDELDSSTANELYSLAIETFDSNLRYDIFELLVSNGGERFQEELIDIALRSGKRIIRQQAAHALLVAHEDIATHVLRRITPKVLVRKTPSVVSRLLLLLAVAGDVDAVVAAAETLSTSPKRRVLLLLVIWQIGEDNLQLAQRIANMLPAGSAAVSWALAGAREEIVHAELDSLGDAGCVEQVLHLMQPLVESD